MRPLRHLAASLLCLACCMLPARATTWDEPWHREVVSGADTLGLYEIVTSAHDVLTLKLVKHLAGAATDADVTVTSFYALRLTSRSGDGPGFRMRPGDQAYFYLKKTGATWALATPSAGYALVKPAQQVAATYRISMHQAMVDVALYEDTQRCIFGLLHGSTACDPQVAAFIDATLAQAPEGIIGNDAPVRQAVFFRQHAALETAAFLQYPVADATLAPFLAKPDTHVQISAVRLLAAGKRPDTAERLMQWVENEHADTAARIMAATLLEESGAHGMKPRLLAYAAHASEQQSGLGIGIMDPRIGTRYPHTLREAVTHAGQQL